MMYVWNYFKLCLSRWHSICNFLKSILMNVPKRVNEYIIHASFENIINSPLK
jgi:hypothetical protein